MTSRAPAIALTAGAAALTALFVIRFAPARLLLLETARPAIAALIVLLAAYAFGRAALRAVRSDDDSIASATLIGFATLGSVAGIFAIFSTSFAPIIAVIASFAGAFLLGKTKPQFERAHPLLIIAIALALICAITPVNSPDELAYKLAVPHAWQLFGRMIELPLSSHSYLAMALQCADLAALALGGGIAAKLAHFGLYLAALVVVRRVGGDRAAIALAFTPALMIIAGWAWSEWGVLGLLLLSYERWSRDDVRGGACALGCAIAAKYTALPWLLATAIVKRKTFAGAIVIIALFGSFFYVRNLIWTGSPVAPMLLSDSPPLAGYRGNAWLAMIQGGDVFDARVADESLGIVLPLAFVAGFFAWKRRRDLVLIGAIQMPILLTIAPTSRNLINGIAPIAIAGAEMIPIALMAIPIVAQVVLVAFTLESYDVAPYLAGKETERQYIARTRAFAAPFEWISRNTPPDARLLVLAENRTFYLDRQFIAGGNLDSPRIAAWLGRFTTPDAFRAELRARGITHIVIHMPWYRVGAQPPGMIEKEFILQLPPATHNVLTQYLASRARLAYRDREYLVYACF